MADRKLPRKTGLEAKNLVESLSYDREFCRHAGLDYNSLSEEDTRLIKIAIADYLLRKNTA